MKQRVAALALGLFAIACAGASHSRRRGVQQALESPLAQTVAWCALRLQHEANDFSQRVAAFRTTRGYDPALDTLQIEQWTDEARDDDVRGWAPYPVAEVRVRPQDTPGRGLYPEPNDLRGNRRPPRDYAAEALVRVEPSRSEFSCLGTLGWMWVGAAHSSKRGFVTVGLFDRITVTVLVPDDHEAVWRDFEESFERALDDCRAFDERFKPPCSIDSARPRYDRRRGSAAQ